MLSRKALWFNGGTIAILLAIIIFITPLPDTLIFTQNIAGLGNEPIQVRIGQFESTGSQQTDCKYSVGSGDYTTGTIDSTTGTSASLPVGETMISVSALKFVVTGSSVQSGIAVADMKVGGFSSKLRLSGSETMIIPKLFLGCKDFDPNGPVPAVRTFSNYFGSLAGNSFDENNCRYWYEKTFKCGSMTGSFDECSLTGVPNQLWMTANNRMVSGGSSYQEAKTISLSNELSDGSVTFTGVGSHYSGDVQEHECAYGQVKVRPRMSVVVDVNQGSYFEGTTGKAVVTVDNEWSDFEGALLYDFYEKSVFGGERSLEQVLTKHFNKGMNVIELSVPTGGMGNFRLEVLPVMNMPAWSVQKLSGKSDYYRFEGLNVLTKDYMVVPKPIYVETEAKCVSDGSCPTDYKCDINTGYCLLTKVVENKLGCQQIGCPISDNSFYSCTSSGVCAETVYQYKGCSSDSNCPSETACDIPSGSCVRREVFTQLVQCEKSDDCFKPCPGVLTQCDDKQCRYSGSCDIEKFVEIVNNTVIEKEMVEIEKIVFLNVTRIEYLPSPSTGVITSLQEQTSLGMPVGQAVVREPSEQNNSLVIAVIVTALLLWLGKKRR